MIILFQSLFIIFALVAVGSVIRRSKDDMLGPKAMIFWILFWLAAIVVVLWPESASKIAEFFGIGRGADLVVYASLAIVFYLLFKLNVKLDSLNRDITKVVRKNALEKSKQERAE
ncbi:MAG: hypothetical protein A3C90_00355 [Candidatus Magasanikbacteria bacterium RIFCSPHIGHO2_02_FULL_51_14]|uniref:DUF2304 domain-containing protein n=1 Tax=Candidatus Magasanikbacteria bacterium RIFCSPHIGHO2_02_FULL_51_14 TaxID=1798683 RepID=A0A1F6MD17_9BACT|nr:MAG: hypothetical protein A3C90_00355 [Candidatus Magasanikbacteria bacterium RIFCSPHIGHO2_02_FULL_51_14]